MFKIKYLLPAFILALLLLIPAGVTADNNAANSLQIDIGGTPVSGPISKGDTIYEDRATPGPDHAGCANPDISIRAESDVARVRVGPEEDSCNIVVHALDLRANSLNADDPSAHYNIGTELGYKWKIEIIGKIVGVNSVDDLTKTTSRFTVKTATNTNSGDLFDGNNRYHSCWAKWLIPFWYYKVKKCDKSHDLDSSTYMYVDTKGTYTHTLVSAAGHSVRTRATARGNKPIDDAFGYLCTQSSKPTGSSLECDFTVTYLGYN